MQFDLCEICNCKSNCLMVRVTYVWFIERDHCQIYNWKHLGCLYWIIIILSYHSPQVWSRHNLYSMTEEFLHGYQYVHTWNLDLDNHSCYSLSKSPDKLDLNVCFNWNNLCWLVLWSMLRKIWITPMWLDWWCQPVCQHGKILCEWIIYTLLCWRK